MDNQTSSQQRFYFPIQILIIFGPWTNWMGDKHQEIIFLNAQKHEDNKKWRGDQVRKHTQTFLINIYTHWVFLGESSRKCLGVGIMKMLLNTLNTLNGLDAFNLEKGSIPVFKFYMITVCCQRSIKRLKSSKILAMNLVDRWPLPLPDPGRRKFHRLRKCIV